MTQILGFTGRKRAGKDTACNFVLALKLAELGISRSVRLSEKGGVEVTDILGESVQGEEWFPFASPYVETASLFDDRLGESIRVYSFARKLKQIAIDLFGLDPEVVCGNYNGKEKKTTLKWQDMPTKVGKKGKMTVREVLQYLGTDIFRKMYEDVWVDACLRQIKRDSPKIALVSDVRFENEVLALQKADGYVVGLTRSTGDNDSHDSETSVEKCLELCDAVIDNKDLTIPEQNEQIYMTTKHLDIYPEMENKE